MNFFILIRTKCSLIRPNFSKFSGGGCYSSIRAFGPQTPPPPSNAKKPVYESGQGWKSRNVELAILYTHNSVLSKHISDVNCHLFDPLHSPPLFKTLSLSQNKAHLFSAKICADIPLLPHAIG